MPPLYEYKCLKCDKAFDATSSQYLTIAEDPGVTCPDCGEVALRNGISTTQPPIFKGSGFYETDYKRKGR